MDSPTDALDGLSLRDHLLYHGSEDTNGFTFLRLEPTNDTDKNGKWILGYKTAKETAVTTCISQLIPDLRKKAPELFSNASIGGQRNDGFEAYATFLRNLTPESTTSNSNGGNNRTQTNGNRNRNNNYRSSVTIAYDEESFPELTTPKIVPPNQPPSTSLTKAKRMIKPVDASRKKDTYASRTVATSSAKSTSKATNKTSVADSDKSGSAEDTKQRSQDANDALIQRMTAIMDTRMAMNESKNEIRLAKMESKLIHHDAANKRIEASTSKEIKELGKLIAILTEQVVTLLNRSQPQNETTDNTERIFASKRRPESTPSPSGATKHVVKRKPRLEPIQLDEDFANNEVHKTITEDDEDSQMDDTEPTYTDSRSSSPSFSIANNTEGSEAGGMNTQPGSQES
jgi:hypothetical protein